MLKGLEILVGHTPARSQQGTSAPTKAKQILSCIHRAVLTGTRAVIIPLCSTLDRLHLEHSPRLKPQFKKDTDRLETAQRRATKVIKGKDSRS